MKTPTDELAFVINVHERLTRDFPLTPYNSWCRKVHSDTSLSPAQKWEYLLNWSIDPKDYINPTLFASDWQLFKLLSKLSLNGKPTKAECDVAYQKFLYAEARCKLVNDMFTKGDLPPGLSRLLNSVIKIVDRVLGPVEDFFNWIEKYEFSDPLLRGSKREISAACQEYRVDAVNPAFGPGVSVASDGSSLNSQGQKVTIGSVTVNCSWMSNYVTSQWNIRQPVVVEGDVLAFVVKKVGEARTICSGPSMNVLIQKLLGEFIRIRLKTVTGIDLKDQSRNAQFARLGSLCDSYATADQTSASDLYSYMFVMNSLSFSWFHLLDSARSPRYWDPRKEEFMEYEKFSTMGNGFTFELETLLFYAVVKSAVYTFSQNTLSDHEIAVYGDDLIFPKQYYGIIQQSLTICGHIPNLEKSFSAGPFRESCGGDYFNGWDVTPFKIKELSFEKPRSIVNIYNGLFACSRGASAGLCDSLWFNRALLFIKSWLSKHHPKLAEGYPEYVSDLFGNCVPTPSNRWIWNDDPRVNVVWSRSLCQRVPVYLLTEVTKNRTDYEISPDVIGYFVAHGTQPSNISTTTERFVRNHYL